MNIVGSLTARSNNPKGNLFIIGKKNKTSSLEINIIINNTTKAKKNDDPDSSDSKGNLRRGDKRGEKFYDKKNNDENGKVQIAKLNKYHEEREKLKF